MNRCTDCYKPVIENETDEYKAARRPSHWCTCPAMTTQKLADKFPTVFGSGYENEHEWKEKYTTQPVATLSQKRDCVSSD